MFLTFSLPGQIDLVIINADKIILIEENAKDGSSTITLEGGRQISVDIEIEDIEKQLNKIL